MLFVLFCKGLGDEGGGVARELTTNITQLRGVFYQLEGRRKEDREKKQVPWMLLAGIPLCISALPGMASSSVLGEEP